MEALDALLRQEVDLLKKRILTHGAGGLAASLGASDAANEAILRLLKQDPAPNFESPSALRAYLWRCARNLLVDRLRARRGNSVRLDATDASCFQEILASSGTQRAVDEGEWNDALVVAMNLLSEDDRQVLELAYMEGRSVKDIAKAVGASPEAVKMRLVRARRRLAEKLARWREVIVGDDR